MARKATFTLYKAKTILNKAKRADHWFWTRYSAYPYIGCQHGCEFCYSRENKFSQFDDLDEFAYKIRVKENAHLLLQRALSRVPVDLISVGDYQPAERKFEITRKMLQVCYDMGFPVFVLSRSPLVLRDLDILTKIQKQTRAVVLFSIISTPDSSHYSAVKQIERLTPSVERRFAAMKQVAAAGILTGTSFMPILPDFCDDDENIENVIKWTSNHGGKFVLASSLTLADQQRIFFLKLLAEKFPDQVNHYQALYPSGSYAPVYWGRSGITQRIREFCRKYKIFDRMPRPIIPGEKRELTKHIVEYLADRAYELDIMGASSYRGWAYRKAAWSLEDVEQDIGLIYDQLGLKGIESIKDVGPKMAQEIEKLIIMDRNSLCV